MFTIKQRIDLQAVNPMRIYEQPLEYGNKRAHEWTVEIISGGKPADLAGMTANVTWIRPAGPQEVKENPALLSVCMTMPAEIAGNRVRCVLDGGCYGGIGPAVGKMQLSKGGELTAAALMAARIEKNSAEAIIDPTHIVPSVEALLEKIGAMDEGTKATLEAAGKANKAAGAANTAAGKANEAASAANSAAGKANEAAQTASEAAGTASGAAGRAAEAAGAANTAAAEANAAAGEARQAAGAANTAAGEANAAAGKANKAAAEIQGAQTAAEQAVKDAQTAVQGAQTAVQTAEAWAGATATAETIPYGQPPTVTVSDGPDGRVLHMQVPEGKPGAKASFDDELISDTKGWSSQQIVEYGVEHYFTPFDAKSGIVQGTLVPNYPLHVISYIEPIQNGSGTPSPTNIRSIRGLDKTTLTVCGSNILRINANSTTKNGLTYNITNGRIRVTGTATKREPFSFNARDIPINGNVVYAYGLPEGGSTADAFIEAHVTMTDGSTQWLQIKGLPSVWGNAKLIDKINDIYIIVNAGKTVDITFEPMLKLSNENGAFEQFGGEILEQNLSGVADGNAIYGGDFDWNSGLFKQKYIMIEKKVSDMDDSRQDYPGWTLTDNKLRTVFGKNVNDTVHDAISNVGTVVGANTTMTYDVIYLSRSGETTDMTVAQWKQRYPNLTVQILVPYKVRPTIELHAHMLFPRKTGITTVYGNTNSVEVFGRLDPAGEKAYADRRIKSLEEENQMLKGCVMELSAIVYA